MRLFIPITTAVLGRGLLATVVVLTACDAGGADTPQLCRAHVSTIAVTRATYKFNVLREAALRATPDGEGEVVTKVGRYSTDDVHAALARAADELRAAQDELDARLRGCGGN